MGNLEKGGWRPVWVKAVLHNDNGVNRVVPLNSEGNEMWEWMMYEDGVAHIPRFAEANDNSAVMPADRVAYGLFPPPL